MCYRIGSEFHIYWNVRRNKSTKLFWRNCDRWIMPYLTCTLHMHTHVRNQHAYEICYSRMVVSFLYHFYIQLFNSGLTFICLRWSKIKTGSKIITFVRSFQKLALNKWQLHYFLWNFELFTFKNLNSFNLRDG